jgi:hypothetical protein
MTNTMTTIEPKAEYFQTATAHSGIITHHKTVYGMPTRQSGTEVWRVWVRILTSEGWTLMGYIGSTDKELDLPKIKKGDSVELDPLILSDWKRELGKDERPKDFARTLTGKILRAPRVIVPSVAAPVDYSDFAMPPVFALINRDGDGATIFVQNPWHPEHVFTREMVLHNDGQWRWSCGNTHTSPEAVSEWDFLVAQGHTPRDVIKSPLNGTPANYSAADEFACNFSMGSYQFKYLVVAHGGNYPRKTKV